MSKKFSLNDNLISIPWFESLLAKKILKNKKNISSNYKKKS